MTKELLKPREFKHDSCKVESDVLLITCHAQRVSPNHEPYEQPNN